VRPWTTKEVQFLLANLHLGIKGVGRALGRSRAAVMGQLIRLRRAGKAPRTRRAYRPVLSRLGSLGPKVQELYEKGYSDVDVGKTLHLSKTSVAKVRAVLGLPAQPDKTRTRAKLSTLVNTHRNLFIDNALKAEGLGWPGRTFAEARALNVLFEKGPCRTREIVEHLGQGWKGCHAAASARMMKLHREGLVLRQGWKWLLAPGVEPGVVEADEEE
jgi:hypothetical protein